MWKRGVPREAGLYWVKFKEKPHKAPQIQLIKVKMWETEGATMMIELPMAYSFDTDKSWMMSLTPEFSKIEGYKPIERPQRSRYAASTTTDGM
jgi:hypothetical protein